MKPEYPINAPEFGEMVNIAENIDWLRLPLPMALNHINIYILRDDDGVTIIDTGVKTEKTKAIWRDVIERYIAPEPIKRVLLTHYHPDHLGLAGWFNAEFDATLILSRMSYLLARMLQLDVQERPAEHHAQYWARVGYDREWINERMSREPFNFLSATEMLPLGVRALLEGEEIALAGRKWQVRFGQGHAPDHVTLWSDDFVIIGDQCLPAITPVISTYATEPNANSLGEFMDASKKLSEFARDDQLFLCGHNRPFYGGHSRLLAHIAHHEEVLERMKAELKTPKTMIDCYPLLFNRKITPELEGFAISEAVAHFNYLEQAGEVESFLDKDDITRWRLLA